MSCNLHKHILADVEKGDGRKKCSIIEIAQLEMPENEEEYDPLTMLWE